jgi:four helix bundle protein
MAQDYKDLIAWRKAMELVTEIYLATKGFPTPEKHGLTSQIRRAAVSVPSNIAEGKGRLNVGEFRQYLGHARGSLLETETQVIISENLGYLDSEKAERLLVKTAELGKVLNGLINALHSNKPDY